MRLGAMILRIIHQILRDKRTIALIVFAPIFVLTLVNFILNSEDKSYKIGVVNATNSFVDTLQDNENYEVSIEAVTDNELEDKVHDGELNGGVIFGEDTATIIVSGVDQTVASKVTMLIKTADAKLKKEELQQKLEEVKEKTKGAMDIAYSEQEFQVNYVVGEAEGTLFDKFGTQLIGVIVFFFVFLIAGINFLGERTSGTMEKLLSTPIRRSEVVVGYLTGYSVLAILQSTILIIFSVYVLDLKVNGSLGFVILVTLLTAINALSLGILLSTLANSEFQMMQFIPIVILPQIFLCGLFRVSGFWSKFAYIMPLHYTSNALTEVMMKGSGISKIIPDLSFLIGMSFLIILANIVLLKKQRRI